MVSRLVLLIACATCLGFLARNTVAQWSLYGATPAKLARGLRWNPQNPALHAEDARQRLFLPDGTQLPNAAAGYRRAASLNPLNSDSWIGLADAYRGMNEVNSAERALRAALVAAPHSPDAAWRLGNLLLLQNRAPEAFPYFRTAAAYDPAVRSAVFELAWKLLDEPDTILGEIIPPGAEPRSAYFLFLLQKGKLREAYPVWKEIQGTKAETILRLGKSYVEMLTSAGMGPEASSAWGEWLAAAGRSHRKPSGELLTDGDFEQGLASGGLEWRWTKGEGYQITYDEFAAQNGTRSLRVDFDGRANPEFAAVWQAVPVEPGRRYRFEGYLKTENITSDSGLHFLLYSQAAPAAEAMSVSTEPRIGSIGWTREELDFQTGPHTTVMVLVLHRAQSKKLNNLLGGKAWIDDLSLKLRD